MNSTASIASAYAPPDASNRTVMILSALLLVQIVGATALAVNEASTQTVKMDATAYPSDLSTVNSITIEERLGKDQPPTSLQLTKNHDQWVIPNYYNLPATEVQVISLLHGLHELKLGLPITTSSNADQRFEVGKDDFRRSITLAAGTVKQPTLYLGASPVFRTVYGRLGDSKDIYSLQMPEDTITASPDYWIDHSLGQVRLSDIAAIDTGTYVLKKDSGHWNLIAQGQEHTISKRVAAAQLAPLGDFRINRALGTKPEPSYDVQHPAKTVNVTLLSGPTLKFSFYTPKDNPDNVLKLSNRDQFFSVPAAILQRIQASTVASILAQEKAVEERSKTKPAGKSEPAAKEKQPGTKP